MPIDLAGIVGKHGRMVFQTAFRVLGNMADAEDVAQDVFVSTLHPKPFVGPSDSVMLTLEGAATGDKKAVYWFAADRGHMIVRSERSYSRDKPSDWIDTIIVDSAEQSPQGRWYPTQVRHGRIKKSGDDLRPDTGVAPVATLVYRYLVEFE